MIRHFSCVIVLSLALLGASSSTESCAASFAAFVKRFSRKYPSEQEYQRRQRIFCANMKKAAQLSKENPKAHFGENLFADVSEQEFARRKNHLIPQSIAARAPLARMRPVDAQTIPEAIDWRQHGKVTSVKNQGECGSCWAFSATTTIESQWAMAGNRLVNLSEQEIVSCDYNDGGCNGGDPGSAGLFLLVARQGQLATLDSIPYAQSSLVNGTPPRCRDLSPEVVGATISNVEGIEHDENVMAAWTAKYGPMSICVDSTSFQWYVDGIITNCTSLSLDHCIGLVGYNATGPIPYWIVKNSWTAQWGVDGYVFIEKGTNQCLLTADPSASVV